MEGKRKEGGCFSSYIRHSSLGCICNGNTEKSVILRRHQYLVDVYIVFILKSRFIVKLCPSPREVRSELHIFYVIINLGY